MSTSANTILRTLRGAAVIGTLAAALSACGSTEWGFPYRQNVQQGNWITAEQVARLEPGMSREQVRFLLGTPTLLDVFHSDRWDYPYYYQPGYGEPERRRFSVWFEGDTLVRWEGDSQPDRQPYQPANTGAPSAAAETPPSRAEAGSPAAEGTPTSSGAAPEPLR